MSQSDTLLLWQFFTHFARRVHMIILLVHYDVNVQKRRTKCKELNDMFRNNGIPKAGKGLILLALVLAAIIPFSALATTATDSTSSTTDATTQATAPQQAGFGGNGGGPGGNGGNGGMQGFNNGVNSNSADITLTDDQQATYDKAVTLYEQIEDAVLADLVSAGVVSQADVDSYTALRQAEKSMDELDQSTWTAAQYKAYYEATAKTGDERKAALQALADAGQLTQAQADAMSAENQTDLWSTISRNASTNSDIQTAMNTMQQARQTLNATLKEAGIQGTMTDNNLFGNMGGGNGMMPGNGRNASEGGNGMQNNRQDSTSQTDPAQESQAGSL
jgi:hypothetical protein